MAADVSFHDTPACFARKADDLITLIRYRYLCFDDAERFRYIVAAHKKDTVYIEYVVDLFYGVTSALQTYGVNTYI